MKGREETDLKWDAKTMKKLEDCPSILGDYYYSLIDKTRMTTYRYVSYVKDFLDSINCENDFASIKTSDINKYIQSLDKNNGQSIKATRFYAISNFFEFLMDEELVDKNPCKRASKPKLKGVKDVVYLTEEEIELIKSNIRNNTKGWCRTRDLAILVLAIRTGMRVTSICEINISDINFEEGYITAVEKGNKVREIPISENTIKMLLNWIDERNAMWGTYEKNDALFVANTRKRISQKSIERMVKKNSKGINKKITPHKLRSTCATNLYDKTGDIYLVADVLGHANIQNTKRYTNIGQEKKNKVKEIMDSIA